MSSYALASADHHHQFTNYDKVAAYHNALQNSKANFSVSHLLDLEELPSENCAMFANTEPQPGLPTQTCTPNMNGAGGVLTDVGDDCPSPNTDRSGSQQPKDSPQSKCTVYACMVSTNPFLK